MATSKDRLSVRILEQDTVDWETYVTNHSKGTFYHLPQWFEVLRRSYNHHIFLLVTEDDQGSIQGCMPLVRITFPLLGSKLISLPYQGVIGGPIADSDESAEMLVEKAINLGLEVKADYIELRNCTMDTLLKNKGFEKQNTGAFDSTVDLSDIELQKLRKNHIRDIKSARNFGIKVKSAEDLDNWRIFYEIFERQQRAFSNPGFGWKFFRELHRLDRLKVTMQLAWMGNKCLGGTLLFAQGHILFHKISALDPRYLSHGTFKILIWESMNWAKKHGMQWYDFGVTMQNQKGLLSFKEGFCAVSRPLYTHMFTLTKSPASFKELFEGYSTVRKIWPLLPLSMTKWAGSLASRWFC